MAMAKAAGMKLPLEIKSIKDGTELRDKSNARKNNNDES